MRLYGILRFGSRPAAVCPPERTSCEGAATVGSWRRDRTELTPGGRRPASTDDPAQPQQR